MGTLVEIKQLRKAFGPILAVDDVSFTVGQGEVLGFLGPNGAGKSTTMKMVTGFLTPTGGTALVGGYDIQKQPLEAKRRIGYLPEGAPVYQDMTPARFLSFIAEVRGYGGEELRRRVADIVEKVNLESVLDQPIDTLSKGFRRRVGLAQAILHDPEVLVLDEPTDGLDPNQKHEVRTLIKAMARDKAIILSTHILEEVHAVCTRAIIIAKGKVVWDGTPAELEAQSECHNAVTLGVKVSTASGAAETLQQLIGVHQVDVLTEDRGVQRLRVFPKQGRSIAHLVSQCAREHNWEVSEMQVERGQLDEVFRSLTASTQELT